MIMIIVMWAYFDNRNSHWESYLTKASSYISNWLKLQNELSIQHCLTSHLKPRCNAGVTAGMIQRSFRSINPEINKKSKMDLSCVLRSQYILAWSLHFLYCFSFKELKLTLPKVMFSKSRSLSLFMHVSFRALRMTFTHIRGSIYVS